MAKKQLNYMLIGASKCGTSTICNHLSQHPDIFMVECKEPQFFSIDSVYDQGIDWYESLYDGVNTEKMIGEGSNTYTMKEVFPKTLDRMVSYFENIQDLKLIYCVRDPIRRIESYWLELRAHGGESVHYDFNQAVRVNRKWLVDSSNYWQQINVYRSLVPDHNIHIIFFEDFIRSPQEIMSQCFDFLGVDPDVPLKDRELHFGQTSGRKIPRNILSKLRAYWLFRTGAKLVPEFLREFLKEHFLFKPITGHPQLNPQAREWVVDILEKDTEQFLEFYNKPKDFWKLRNE
jgi:hypothetical protein